MENDELNINNINETEEGNEDVILIGYDGDDGKGSIDSLSSRSSYYPLSANQGRVLNDKVEGFLDNINNLENKIGTLLDIFYPIGSIYQSTKSIDPNNVIGGTWQKIEGRFLIGSSSAYSLGSTGGSPTHTLTESQLPQISRSISTSSDTHAHGIKYTDLKPNGTSGTTIHAMTTNGKNTSSTAIMTNDVHNHSISFTFGSGNAHNNMPPYKVINMWERIG